MTQTTDVEQNVAELKTKLQDGKVVLGTENVVKRLRLGTVQKVFLARNCPSSVKQDILHYAKLSKIPVEELWFDNEELGVFCKKSFFVSVLGIVK